MSERPLPPCGHADRATELTEIDLSNTMGNVVTLLVCTVPGCREYGRAYVDLRDTPLGDEDFVE